MSWSKEPGIRSKVQTKVEDAVKFKCDFHPWMIAYAFVIDHPFWAVTDEAGNYTIEGLPPGTYTVEVWHEKYKKKRQEITVSGDAADVNFSYGG